MIISYNKFIKKKYLEFFVLHIFLILISLIYLIYRDIDNIVFSVKGISDLGQYYSDYYYNHSISHIMYKGFTEKIFYKFITLVFYELGFSFKFFIFIVFYFYFSIFLYSFHQLTGSKIWSLYFLLFLLLTFWLKPLVTVALPQGVAFICLLTLYFRKNQLSLSKKLLIVFLASGLHFSAIVFLPFIFLEKIFLKYTKILEVIFILTFILYFLNLAYLISDFFVLFASKTSLDIGALNSTNKTYKIGFSLLKSISIVVPILFFRITNYFHSSQNIFGRKLYVIYIYISIIGMLLSHLPYNDRLLLYGWGLTPIMLCAFVYMLLVKISKYQKLFSMNSLK